MKNLIIAPIVLIATFAVTTSGQVKSEVAENDQRGSQSATPGQDPANATGARVSGQDTKVPAPSEDPGSGPNVQSHPKSDFNNHAGTAQLRRVSAVTEKSLSNETTDGTKAVTPNPNPRISTSATARSSNSGTNSSSPAATSASQLYRVGIYDVLDIRLAGNPSANSTLFTVLVSGLIEYPLAGNPIPVAGLTTAEIADIIRQRIRIFEKPAITVNVRDYASHTVTVTGFVTAPGTKILHREAVPLYAILSEALVLPEATRATIKREGRAPIVVDLKDSNLSSPLVVPGDAIRVSLMPPGPTEFFFIGGKINSPGQKPYHAGLTLTQAILASEGVSTSAGSRVRVSRQGSDGLLITEEYNIRKIQSGKMPDPVLQKGDRIEVTAVN